MKNEIAKGEMLSGHAYVRVCLKESGRESGCVRVRKPHNCDHCETICRDCAESWSIDYTIFFSATAGGRRLALEMESA